MTPRLGRLFAPRSVAAIGGRFAEAVVAQCAKIGFPGKLYPVHPTRRDVAGVRAYARLAELPSAPDVAFVGVNRTAAIEAIRELRGMGAGGVVCFAAGFRETSAYDPDGERLHLALLKAAGDMPLIGPNCYGFLNYADRAALWPDQHGGVPLTPGCRGAAIVAQSSNIAINLTMQRRGLPLAFVATVGNQAQIGLSEVAATLIEDARVSCLGLHIEGVDSAEGFERLAARARELAKPIVVLKVGRSEAARAGAVSHTASLSGSDVASSAFFARIGVARVGSIPSLVEALKLLHVHGPLGGGALSSMSCSGGEAAMVSDAAVGRGVSFPKLDAAHRARVQAALGPRVAIANPLDYHTFIWNDEAAMRATFAALAGGPFDLNWLVLDFPRQDRCDASDWATTLRAFRSALTDAKAKGAVVATLPENLPEAAAAELIAAGIAPLCGVAEALDACEAAARIGLAWAASTPAPMLRAPPPARRRTLDEAEAKARLAAAGLRVPAGRRAENADEAAAAVAALGAPVAVKGLGVPHKSDAGLVRLNLRDAASVRAAAADVLDRAPALLVERMVEAGIVELILGVTDEPPYGRMMTIGAGGIFVELLADSATLPLPASEDAIAAALKGLKAFGLMEGRRGRPRADFAAAVAAAAALARFACEAPELVELEVNPLIVRAEGMGAVVADALIVEAEEQ